MRAVRAFLALAVAGCALSVAASAGASDECNGFMVCVSVRGPWVVAPSSTGVSRERVEYQMTCPRGHVVGGLDARLSVRAIDVGFLGTLGTPVNPGISTSRSVVFVGMYVGRSRAAATFRPIIGCIPGSGAGTRVPTSASAVKPGRPVTRRVRQVRVRPGSTTVLQRCAAGERLVGSSFAFAFATRTPPSASLVSSVSAKQSARRSSVVVAVRGDAEISTVRALVQVHALCTRST